MFLQKARRANGSNADHRSQCQYEGSYLEESTWFQDAGPFSSIASAASSQATARCTLNTLGALLLMCPSQYFTWSAASCQQHLSL